MNALRVFWARLRAVFGRGGLEAEMQSEIRSHIEQSTARLVARGLPLAEARAEARREFGIVSVIEEDGRDARGTRLLESIVADLRFAFRYFARKPLMAATIIIVLALGIGANSAMVSFIQAFLTRPAPAVPKIGHMVVYGLEQETKSARWSLRDFSYREMSALAEHKEVFTHVAGYDLQEVIVGRDSTQARREINALFVTANYWRAVGIAITGPGFAEPVDGVEDLAVVISYELAEELFDTAASAVGRRVVVNEVPVRVAGVAPYRFQGLVADQGRPNMWAPLSARTALTRAAPTWLNESQLRVFARLAPGVSAEQATAVARSVVAQYIPDSVTVAGRVRSAEVLPTPGRGPSVIGDDVIITFGALGLVSILILLVACTNVSSLMVAAAVGRRHEIAVRLSMGAPRTRVLRQLVTESSVLALAGGSLGLLLYWWFTKIVGSRLHMDITPDLVTVAFTLAFALGTGLVFGLSPALHATRSAVGSALKDSGAGVIRRSRLQGAFVVAQIVFSQPLLLILALVLREVAGGYNPTSPVTDRVIVAMMRPFDRGVGAEQGAAAIDTLALRLANQPGIARVVNDASGFAMRNVAVVGADGGTNQVQVILEGAAPGYFSLQDIPIVLGRDVAFPDTNSADAAIVMGSDLAREFFGDANPIGRRLMSVQVKDGERDSLALDVVGVYDATQTTTRGPGKRLFTAKGRHWRRDRLLVRTTGPAEAFLPTMQTALRATAPDLVARELKTLRQISDEDRRVENQIMGAAIGAAALALGIASIGLFAVVSLSVGQRRREIGIRIALGGRPYRVAGSFYAAGLRLCAIGVAIGLPASIAAVKVLMSVQVLLAPDFSTPLVGLGIAAVMLVVASAATWFPARRAATVDPTLALRAE